MRQNLKKLLTSYDNEILAQILLINCRISLNIAIDASTMSTVEEITLLITSKAEEIRVLKAAKATKEEITPVVADLLALKER